MSAFAYGLQSGLESDAAAQQHKQALADWNFQNKFLDLTNAKGTLQQKYASTLDKENKPTAASQQYVDALTKNEADQRQLLQSYMHPQTNPGALERLGRWVTNELHITKPEATDFMVNSHPKGLVEPGNLPIWNRPRVNNADGSFSSEYSVSFQDDNGHEVLVPTVVDGKFLTPDGKKPPTGSPAEKAMFKAAWDHYLKTGQNLGKFANPQDADAYAQALHSRGEAPKNIVKEEAQQKQGEAADTAAAQRDVAAAPLSPAYEAAQKSEEANQAWLSTYQTKVDQLRKLDPDMPPDQARRAALELMGVKLAVGLKPPVRLKMKDGSIISAQEDGEGNFYRLGSAEEIPADLIDGLAPKSQTEINHDQYLEAVDKGFKGSEAQWLAEQRAGGSSSQFNETLRAYARAHNTTVDQLPFQAYDFVSRMIALSHALPSTGTTNTIKQDLNGWWVPIQETNTKTPGAGVKLTDPLGPARSNWMAPSATPAPAAPGGAAPPSPAPNGATPSRPAPPPSRPAPAPHHPSAPASSTRVGQPLFQGRTPTTDTDEKNERAAELAYREVLKAATNTNPVDSQNMVMAWLKGKVGRVTQTEIGMVRNLGSLFEKFDGTWNSITKGTMSPTQISWFVKNARENYEAAQAVVDKDRQQGPAVGSGAPQDPQALKNEANKKMWSTPSQPAPDIGDSDIGDDGKRHRYIGGDPGEPKNWPVVAQ